MAFSLTKLFGKNTPQQLDNTEAIIRDVENKPFGVSSNNVLFAGLNELGGYFFFQTVIVGQLNVKSKNGAVLLIKGDDFELELNSDMPEFESESSDIKGRYVTKIDFQVEKSDIKQLENTKLSRIQLSVKQHKVLFIKDAISDEEE